MPKNRLEQLEKEITSWLRAFKYQPKTESNRMIRTGLIINLRQLRAKKAQKAAA